MIRTTLSVAFAFGLLPLAPAQDKSTPAQRFAELQANLVKEVTGQLRSDDLATVAWGAYTAAEFRLATCGPDLRAKLAALAKVEPGKRQYAALAILDALIQTQTNVPGAEVEPYLEGLCERSALRHLGRDSEKNCKAILAVFRRYARGGNATWLACGNWLADAKDPEFVLELLRSPVVLQMQVAERGDAATELFSQLGGSIACSFFTIPDGYPPLARYDFTIGRLPGYTLAVDGPVPVLVDRDTWTSGECRLHDPDDHAFRTARTTWLAQMLESHATTLRFDRAPLRHAEWTDDAQFLALLQTAKTEIENEHRALVAACVAAELIPAKAAEGLVVTIETHLHDWRADKTVPLPAGDATPQKR